MDRFTGQQQHGNSSVLFHIVAFILDSTRAYNEQFYRFVRRFGVKLKHNNWILKYFNLATLHE